MRLSPFGTFSIFLLLHIVAKTYLSEVENSTWLLLGIAHMRLSAQPNLAGNWLYTAELRCSATVSVFGQYMQLLRPVNDLVMLRYTLEPTHIWLTAVWEEVLG